jgi:hypothetical protein
MRKPSKIRYVIFNVQGRDCGAFSNLKEAKKWAPCIGDTIWKYQRVGDTPVFEKPRLP